MSASLTVRDRPWSFWGGAVLLFFGLAMLLVSLLLGGGNIRQQETTAVVRWVATVFAVGGAIACWRGRVAQYDPGSKMLVRGGTIVRDLSKARGLVIYPLANGSPAHYVTLVLGDAEMQPGSTIDQVRGDGNSLLPLAQGVPAGAAKHTTIRWRDALDVAVVQLPGSAVEL